MSLQSSSAFYRTLPRSPNLEHLKAEAKSLKKGLAAGDREARSFIEFHLRATNSDKLAAQPVDIQLADIQFVIAHAYGFKSWPRLKAHVESQALSPKQRGELLLNTLFTDNFTLLGELYERRDSLPAGDIYLAAALGDTKAVDSILASDLKLACLSGGPMQTQPIVYASYGRFGLLDSAYPEKQQHIVKRLLDFGADPNASIAAEARGKDGGGRLSSLYGCCRVPGNPEVVKLLLEAGASTDDGESLYHASELNDTRCLELLFAAGVPKESQEFCIRRALDDENPKAIEIYLEYGTNPNHLDWALFRGRSLQVIRLLVEHGADVNAPTEDYWLLQRIRGLTPLQIAERNGDLAAMEFLLARGAIDNRTAKDILIGACARASREDVRAILAKEPNVLRTLSESDQGYLPTFARVGRIQSVALMLDAGFDIEARSDDLDATALLYAANTGDVDMIRLLLKHGAKLDVKHKYGGAPLETAIYCAANSRSDRARYTESVQVLIAAGEKPTEFDLRFAVENDLEDIADVLKSNGTLL